MSPEWDSKIQNLYYYVPTIQLQWKRYQYYRLLQTIDILLNVPFFIENYYENLAFFEYFCIG